MSRESRPQARMQWIVTLECMVVLTVCFLLLSPADGFGEEKGTGFRMDARRGLSIEYDGKVVAGGPGAVGFRIENLTGKGSSSVNTFEEKNGQGIQKLKDADLELDAKYTMEGNSLKVGMNIRRLSSRAVVFDLIFFIKAPGAVDFSDGIKQQQQTRGVSGDVASSELPLASLLLEGGHGIAMGLNPHFPTTFELGYSSADGFYCKQKLSFMASSPERISTELIIYPVNRDWPFRSALSRYYEIYDSLFHSKVNRYGLWFIGGLDRYPGEKQFYRFHEGERLRLPDEDIASDEKNGILSFPYLVVGQREISADKVPGAGRDMVSILKSYTGVNRGIQADEAVPSDKAALARWILSSGLQDKKGELTYLTRSRNEASVITFPVNPSPNLFNGDKDRAVGAYFMDYIEKRLKGNPAIDGIYVDSIALWSSYPNYSTVHAQYAQLPLTYDAQLNPFLSNYMSHLELLMKLKELTTRNNKLIFGNGIRKGRAYAAFYCDVLGVEGSKDLAHLRLVADKKPALLFLYPGRLKHRDMLSPESLRDIFSQCLLYDVYPSFGPPSLTKDNQSVIEAYRTYVPLLNKLSELGWEPVTGAKSTGQQVSIERYGKSPGEIFLVVHNGSRRDQDLGLTYDTGVFGPLSGYRAFDYRENRSLDLNGTFKLTAGEVKIIKMTATR